MSRHEILIFVMRHLFTLKASYIEILEFLSDWIFRVFLAVIWGSEEGWFGTSDLFVQRSKDLERTVNSHLHTPSISPVWLPFSAILLYGPRLSSFLRLRCKLQYSRAIRSDTKIYASPDQNKIRAFYSLAPRNKGTLLRSLVYSYTCARKRHSRICNIIFIDFLYQSFIKFTI